MNATNRIKLSVMFFLEYVIWGAWLPLLALYLGDDYLKFTGGQQAWIFNAFAIASLTGMFFGGQLADRYFSQEKFLAFSHFVGGLSILGLYYVKSFWPFFGLMLLHCFFYVPTLSITNAIAFANLKDAQKDFGFVRLWGTIGWIAASWPMLFLPKGSVGMIFVFSGAASLLLAAYCLTLPHTPPAKNEGSSFAPLEAIRLLAIPSIAVLFVVTFFDSLTHYGYFFWTSPYLKTLGLPEKWIAAAMSIGQVMEIPAMAVLGWFLKHLGWRKTMTIGIAGQAVRFGMYSLGTPDLLWLVIGVNVVHGFAYACFFATVYIFVDENFPKDVRSSAQSLFNLMILGIAPFASNSLWGWLKDSGVFKIATPGGTEGFAYHQLFLVPMGIAIFAAVLLALFFHPPKKSEPVGVAELPGEPLPSEPSPMAAGG
ncbi:MAG: MFS transporter [Isosphaeraceae bacterium]|nr:MFS transporter [Isosphaeraceae bacterium]